MNKTTYLLLASFLLVALTPVNSHAAAPSLTTPTVSWTSTNKVSSAKATTATLGARITSNGGEALSERGIVWSTSDATPTIGEAGVTKVAGTGTATGVFTVNATGLTSATVIYFQGYATNASGTSYSGISTFFTEPVAQAAAPTFSDPPGANYFDLTVNYTVPADADGVIVVVRQTYPTTYAPYDGTEYTADARIGQGDTIVPGCLFFCDYVVANDTSSGSVNVTGLKANTNHYFAVYAYKGSGAGVTGVNYVQTINSTGPVTTDSDGGISHNQQNVPGFGTDAECAYCHGVHHTSQLLPKGLDQWNKCFSCHDGSVSSKINIGLHLTDGSIDCGTCHSMHSWRTEELYSTNNRTGVKAFNKSYVRANMSKYVNPDDFSPPSGGSITALDNTVFHNKPADYAFSTVDPATGKYNGVCQSCHLATAPYNINHYTQTTADTHRSGLNCAICHIHKQTDQFNAFKPGHQAGGVYVDFDSAGSPDCTACHDASQGVMDGIHGDGAIADCSLCHDGTPNRDNEKLGDSITISGKSPAGDARLADGTAAAGTWASVKCLDCHSGLYHGITIAAVTSKHQLSSNSSRGYDCERCHSTNKTNEQLVTHMPADTVANCVAICHGRTTAAAATTSIVAKGVIDNVTFNDPEPNLNDTKCEHCHAQKGDYTLHGMSDDGSVADGIDNTNGPNSTTGMITHNNLGNSLGIAPTYTGKLATYGGIKATEYNCGQCHSLNPDNIDGSGNPVISTLRAMQLHTRQNGSGDGDCLTCHVDAVSVSDEINAGKGGTGAVQYCESCHSVANGNGPSGKTMYQYDGKRHHALDMAQEGNCIWCHADPRPATTILATGYAATADAVGTYQTGWITDYATSTPAVIPPQPACRLCHTNYETYSVNVNADQNGNTNYGETIDLHGYHINGQTTGYNNTGLTVYANDFDNTNVHASKSYPSGANNRGLRGVNQVKQVSLATHRIEPNAGTEKIYVQNYGACMACHSIQLFHAAPKPTADFQVAGTNNNGLTYDTLRYSPGRSVFNLLPSNNFPTSNNCGINGPNRGNNADDWDQHCEPEEYNNRTWDGDRGRSLMDGTLNKNPSDTPGNGKFYGVYPTASWTQYAIPGDTMSNYEALTGIPVNGTLYNGHGGGIVAFTTNPSYPNLNGIHITVAEWRGSNTVYVEAYTESGTCTDTLAFVSYTPGGCASGNLSCSAGKYTGTCTDAANWSAGDTVTLSNTTTPSGLDVSSRQVADKSNPQGTFVFSAATYSTSETGGSVTINVKRTGGTTGSVTVDYTTADGTATEGQDYTAASGMLSWAPGDGTDKSFIIPIINDSDCSGNETVNLTLDNPTNGADLGIPNTAILTITAKELSGSLQFSSPNYLITEGNSGTTAATITVTRTGGSDCAVSVEYASSDGTALAGSDYAAASGPLNWAAGDAASKTFAINVTGDTNVEPNETVNLTLSNPVLATLGAQSTAVLTINDDDAVQQLDTWVDYTAQAPGNNAGNSGTSLPQTINISAGTNRVMLVALTFELSGSNTMQADPIVRVNNGTGQLFTQISTTTVNAQQHAWLGYITDTQIPATQPFRLYVQWDVNGTTTVASYHVTYGSYQNVNQTTPDRDRIANNGNVTDITFGTQLDYQNGDLSVVVGANGGTPATAIIDNHSGDALNEIAAAANTTNHSSRVFESAVHTGTGNYVNTARVNFSGTTSTRSAVVGVTLQP